VDSVKTRVVELNELARVKRPIKGSHQD